jgi:hypothetical protein
MSREGQGKCLDCQEMKATQCTAYRSLYNNMRMARRLLEALRLGTIKGPDERRAVLDLGWRRVLDSNVEILDMENGDT